MRSARPASRLDAGEQVRAALRPVVVRGGWAGRRSVRPELPGWPFSASQLGRCRPGRHGRVAEMGWRRLPAPGHRRRCASNADRAGHAMAAVTRVLRQRLRRLIAGRAGLRRGPIISRLNRDCVKLRRGHGMCRALAVPEPGRGRDDDRQQSSMPRRGSRAVMRRQAARAGAAVGRECSMAGAANGMDEIRQSGTRQEARRRRIVHCRRPGREPAGALGENDSCPGPMGLSQIKACADTSCNRTT